MPVTKPRRNRVRHRESNDQRNHRDGQELRALATACPVERNVQMRLSQ